MSLSVERTTCKHQSLQLTGYYYEYRRTYTGHIPTYSNKFASKTIEIHPQYRFYIALNHRFYTGPYIKYSRRHEQDYSYDNTYITTTDELDYIQQDIGIGGLIGYQFFIKKRIAIDFSFGLGKTKHISTKTLKGYYNITDASNLIDGFISLNIGYRFFNTH